MNFIKKWLTIPCLLFFVTLFCTSAGPSWSILESMRHFQPSLDRTGNLLTLQLLPGGLTDTVSIPNSSDATTFNGQLPSYYLDGTHFTNGTISGSKWTNLAAYTIRGVNNTSSSAAPTDVTYKQLFNQALDTTLLNWSIGTPPVGCTASYDLTIDGKRVWYSFNIKYTTVGASNTTLLVTLPTTFPAPQRPTGWVTGDYTYSGIGGTQTASNSIYTASRVQMFNSGAVDKIQVTVPSTAAKGATFSGTYTSQ